MINIVLCGGSGTRLWPLSRKMYPKQFAKIFDEKSLFQLTIERNQEICDRFHIVSNESQYFLASDQIKNSMSEKVEYLLEPVGRNTAPAIALSCMSLDYNDIVLVTPSDHLIKNRENYKDVLQKAGNFADENCLVTFGIAPSCPETGYGYIEASGENVINFKEKPDLPTAQKYIEKNNSETDKVAYLWNSGMFCFKAGVFLDELKKHSYEIYKNCKITFENSSYENGMYRFNYDDMVLIPEDSIDYAVMEKSNIVKVVKSNIGWSDVGSFDAMYEEIPKDDLGNAANTDYISISSKNNLIQGEKRKIATIDVEDMIIVDTADALLLSKRESSQKVKKVMEELKNTDDYRMDFHTTVYRPWGSYTILDEQQNCKVKRIVVNPGKRLSLQKHEHRNEHWTVVKGIAKVTVGENIYTLQPNESAYIKKGEKHRLENNGKEPVTIIEIQYGEYTGEDDIIRIEDDFSRAG